jgi:hypothetical protein
MNKHIINKQNNFISGWYLPNKDLCKNLINYFEKSNNKFDGTTNNTRIDKSKKDSTDIIVNIFSEEPLIKEYLKNLLLVLNKYKEIYKYADNPHDKWGITENFNIQRYLPNQGYHVYHTERDGLDSSLRHLTFMTYLNDVSDGGQTEWYYQKLKIKPETGLTVIWGTDWTFTHRGIPSPTQTKYIITGWFSYIK